MAEVTVTVTWALAGGAVGGAVAAAMIGDAMCMVIVPAEPPVVERHMAAADTRVAAAGMAAGAGAEPRN
jgi:hypothetical protein